MITAAAAAANSKTEIFLAMKNRPYLVMRSIMVLKRSYSCISIALKTNPAASSAQVTAMMITKYFFIIQRSLLYYLETGIQ